MFELFVAKRVTISGKAFVLTKPWRWNGSVNLVRLKRMMRITGFQIATYPVNP